MRLLHWRYRGSPKFMMRRLDRAAGEGNGFLTVIALGLAILDFLLAMQRIADSLPPATERIAGGAVWMSAR